jgi:hypothetical protein
MAGKIPVKIPKNFLESPEGKDIFKGKIEEDHSIEQYFWTTRMVKKILSSVQFQFVNCCCFTTPSLAEAFRIEGIDQKLLDIDPRFKYMPRFEKFDICNPHQPEGSGEFEILVIDPPFCGISVEQLFNATNLITNSNYNTKIVIAYLTRFEHALLKTFKPYGISETSASLEYSGVKPNKWGNFTLYSNVDLPGIKRIPGKYGYKGKNYNDKIYNRRHTKC